MAVAYVVAALLVAIGTVVVFPDMTQRWFSRIATARAIVSAIAFVVFGVMFVLSGVDSLIIIGMIMLVFATWRLYFTTDLLEVGRA